MKIEEVQSTTKKQRVATHTHIKGLGLEVFLLTFIFFSLSDFPFSSFPFSTFRDFRVLFIACLSLGICVSSLL